MNVTIQPQSFFDHSKSIVQNFLTTAVVIDDRAMFGNSKTEHSGSNLKQDIDLQGKKNAHPQTSPDDKPFILKEARNRKTGKKIILAEKLAIEELTIPDKENKTLEFSHDLNAKEIIQSFAEKQIICSVIKPEEQDIDSLNETVRKVGQNADLIIIDWQLFHESGDKTLELIKELVASSVSNTPQQLRLICVYTGSRRVDEIFDKIETILKPFQNSSILNSDPDQLMHVIDSCKIVVLIKEGIEVLEQHKNKKVSFLNLPDRLVEEFTTMTSGLLSNVAMESFSVIRQNTHKILTKFSTDLDAPYLNHRSCLEHPPDSKMHIEQLVSNELHALLEEHAVGEKARHTILKLWIEDQLKRSGSFGFETSKEKKGKVTTTSTPVHVKDIIKILEKGLDNKELTLGILTNANRKNIFNFKQFTSFFADPTINSTFLDHKYTSLTTLKSHYANDEPTLSLGTVLYSTNNGIDQYWLCLQPRCDSVRLKGNSRGFPLLPLFPNKGKGIKIVLPHDKNDYEIFQVSLRPYDCKIVEFPPINGEDEIKAFRTANNSFVFSDIKSSQFKWIAELRFEFAQRIVNKFATEISRVGTDNSEFLRRWEQE